MKWVKQILSYVVLLGTMGCAGQVLQDARSVNFEDRRVDGGILDYFLPKALLHVTAKYDAASGVIDISYEQKIMADYTERHSLLYSHAGLATDDITIVTEGGLLKSISSTTQDQIVELVQKFNAVLTQFGVLDAAVKTVGKSDEEIKPKLARPECDKGLSIKKSVNLSDFSYPEETLGYIKSNRCELRLTVKPRLMSKLHARFFPPSGEMLQPNTCDKVVCFRIAGAFKTEIRAALIIDKEADIKTRPRVIAETLAPVQYPLGYIRFGRRAFVKNSTTATFTDGMLTSLKSTDPSEVVGFLSLPVDLLKSLTILVAF